MFLVQYNDRCNDGFEEEICLGNRLLVGAYRFSET